MKIPQSLIFTFAKNESGGYIKTDGAGYFTKVPDELFLNVIRHPEKILAERIIRGRERRGSTYVFQTGIRPINSNLYYGDYYEFTEGKKVNSFILFQFENDGSKLTLHFFNKIKLYPNYRAKFVTEYLMSLNK